MVLDAEANAEAIERFEKEALRIFDVIESHLSGKYTNEAREYFTGPGKGKYSIADIGAWPYVKGLKGLIQFGSPEAQAAKFPHLHEYIDRIAQRPAVQCGIGKGYDREE